MGNTIKRKTDVQTSYHNGGSRGAPMLNVKVHMSHRNVSLPLAEGMYLLPGEDVWREALTHEGFTHEWIDTNLSDGDMQIWWEAACQSGWEMAHETARDIFGPVDMWQEGRSGGWLVVPDLADVEGWDAIDLGKWRTFARHIDAIVEDIPRAFLMLVYMNVYEPAHEAEEAEAADDAAALLPLVGSL